MEKDVAWLIKSEKKETPLSFNRGKCIETRVCIFTSRGRGVIGGKWKIIYEKASVLKSNEN